MSSYVLRIVKGSRQLGSCRRPCRCRLQWARCAPHGNSVPLVEHAVILREERTDRGVVFEIVGSDQVHKCPMPAPKMTAARPHAPAPGRKARQGAGVFSAFTSDRIQQLKQQIDTPAPKPPQPGRLW